MIGTQVGIKDKIISRQSLIIATTSGSNAIIDAIIVKKSKSIVNYKRINGDPNLIIDKKTSTREHGLVHILNSHAEFNNESHRSSEWKTYHQEVEIDISIEVKKDDFKYKISYLEI